MCKKYVNNLILFQIILFNTFSFATIQSSTGFHGGGKSPRHIRNPEEGLL